MSLLPGMCCDLIEVHSLLHGFWVQERAQEILHFCDVIGFFYHHYSIRPVSVDGVSIYGGSCVIYETGALQQPRNYFPAHPNKWTNPDLCVCVCEGDCIWKCFKNPFADLLYQKGVSTYQKDLKQEVKSVLANWDVVKKLWRFPGLASLTDPGLVSVPLPVPSWLSRRALWHIWHLIKMNLLPDLAAQADAGVTWLRCPASMSTRCKGCEEVMISMICTVKHHIESAL